MKRIIFDCTIWNGERVELGAEMMWKIRGDALSVGRLFEVLCNKGVLTPEEAVYVLGDLQGVTARMEPADE